MFGQLTSIDVRTQYIKDQNFLGKVIPYTMHAWYTNFSNLHFKSISAEALYIVGKDYTKIPR